MSSSFEGWHRASAGLPAHFAARVSGRVRVPLFSCMVAYAAPLGLPLDGLTFHGGDVLWFAARSAAITSHAEKSTAHEQNRDATISF